METNCQSPQENNVSECLPKKDKKAYHKAYYEANKEKIKAYYNNNKEILKINRDNNKDKIKEYQKDYYESNKDKIAERQKTYYKDNKEKINKSRKEYQKLYHKANREKIKEYQKDYYEVNKEEILKSNRIYKKIRLKEDPLFAAKEKLRKCVYRSFRRIAQNKPTDTQTLLGCSWQEAKEHFERLFKEGMSWENHGEWHIDHIRPVSSFSEDELHLMNYISNLQPLWEDENLSKSNK